MPYNIHLWGTLCITQFIHKTHYLEDDLEGGALIFCCCSFAAAWAAVAASRANFPNLETPKNPKAVLATLAAWSAAFFVASSAWRAASTPFCISSSFLLMIDLKNLSWYKTKHSYQYSDTGILSKGWIIKIHYSCSILMKLCKND